MRRRIQQLAQGKISGARPLLTFSTDRVDIEVLEGKDYTGDFVITSNNHVPMRGVIYTSDARMECLTPQFEGEEVRIRYQFHSNGLVEGDIQKGEFYVICNQGEYNLSFVVSVSRLYAETSVGKVCGLNDFAKLARESGTEAYHLFYSPGFRNVIKEDESREMLLYEGLSQGSSSGQRVEEFLTGIHKKQPVEISLAQTERTHDLVLESRRETVELTRSQWGYVEIEVESDAAFLEPERRKLTEEDFIGSVCEMGYYIREKELHAGINFGRLTFSFPGGSRTYEVRALRKRKKEAVEQTGRRMVKEGRIRLLQLYMDYRLKRIVTGAWANQSVQVLEHLMALCPEDELYLLMKAQALIVNRQRQEAAWIMEEFKRGSAGEHVGKRETPVWGYYLYLCTLMEREPSYVDRLAEEIEQLFGKFPDDSLLFWVLLFVKEEYYRDHAKRYKVIEQWMMAGKSRSPYLYLEAYYLLSQDPYLLRHLGTFEVSVLGWARRQGAITRDLALQVMHALPEQKGFDRFIYRILEACFEAEQGDEMLSAICAYLIKGQRYETKYHHWYEQGIARGLRLTSLYEAYLMSMDTRQVHAVPRVLQMYFQYDSALSYSQKAVLFVNIIAGKQRQPEVYQKYRKTIEQFALEQMEAGHISDNLAVIYDEVLHVGVPGRELARQLSAVLFAHRLTCMDRTVSQVMVWHEELKEPQIVPVVNGVAYFHAYTPNYCVILEDTRGNCFCREVSYQDEAMMNPAAYIERCLEHVPDELPYLLYALCQPEAVTDERKRMDMIAVLLDSDRISRRFETRLLSEVLCHCKDQEMGHLYRNDGMEEYLQRADAGLLPAADRRQMMELYVQMYRLKEAYAMVQIYGYDHLSSAACVSLCSYAITEAEFEEDDFLLGFAENTFLLGKYNDVLLIYLCKYYNGATRRMAAVWKAAGEFQIDTFDLEERILTQMLYTTEYTPYAEQIYDSYYAGGGRELICMAYLSYFAHMYLTQDMVVPSHVFTQIKDRLRDDRETNDACCLGLLKNLSEREQLTEAQTALADGLLGSYIGRGIYFSFYRRFPPKLIQKYQLYDKFFLEYHTMPHRRVAVHYCMGEEDYRSEDLMEMYDGIYVRGFVLFFGETVQYYITEEIDSDSKVMESDCIKNHDVISTEEDQGRYTKLNEMLMQLALEDTGRLKHQMMDYYGMLRVTEEAFKLL